MGDFNDNPKSESIADNLAQELYNPMEDLLSYKRGTSKYQNNWYLFDQILVSPHLLQSDKTGIEFIKADIFDPLFLKEYSGRFKGNPFRTFVGKKHLGGFSDHFPVYGTFSIHKI